MTQTRSCIALALAMAAGAAFAQNDKPAPKAAPKPVATPTASAPEKGRDWSQIDTNKDGYVSPEEMETWLKANPGPQK